MACEVFIPFKPRAATLTVIKQANTIIDEYLAQDFKLTLKQLFYQFVSRHLLENIFTNYKRLGVIVRNARDGGLITRVAAKIGCLRQSATVKYGHDDIEDLA